MEKEIKSIEDIEVVRCDMDEAETTICIDRGSKVAQIYTSDNTMLTKLKKQMAKNSDWKCSIAGRSADGYVTGYFFEVPTKAISIRSGLKKEVSEENRAAARTRLKEARGRKNEKKEND